MHRAKQKLLDAVARLQRAAEAYPIQACAKTLHPRHQLILQDNTVISFTRNITGAGEAYYLSVKGPRRLPNQHEMDYLVSLFFDRRRPVQELMGITTPGVRCVAQPIGRSRDARIAV